MSMTFTPQQKEVRRLCRIIARLLDRANFRAVASGTGRTLSFVYLPKADLKYVAALLTRELKLDLVHLPATTKEPSVLSVLGIDEFTHKAKSSSRVRGSNKQKVVEMRTGAGKKDFNKWWKKTVNS